MKKMEKRLYTFFRTLVIYLYHIAIQKYSVKYIDTYKESDSRLHHRSLKEKFQKVLVNVLYSKERQLAWAEGHIIHSTTGIQTFHWIFRANGSVIIIMAHCSLIRRF